MAKKIKFKAEGIFKSAAEAEKNILPVLLGAGERAVGVVGAAWAMPQMAKYMGSMSKMLGPVVAVLGCVGEAFSDNEHLTPIMQGIQTAGIMRTTYDLVPSMNTIVTSGLQTKLVATGTGTAPQTNTTSTGTTPVKGIGAADDYQTLIAGLGAAIDRAEIDLGRSAHHSHGHSHSLRGDDALSMIGGA